MRSDKSIVNVAWQIEYQKAISNVKISSYIAQYPVLRIVQSAFTFYFPGKLVQPYTISTFLGGIQPCCKFCVKATHIDIHHCI